MRWVATKIGSVLEALPGLEKRPLGPVTREAFSSRGHETITLPGGYLIHSPVCSCLNSPHPERYVEVEVRRWGRRRRLRFEAWGAVERVGVRWV